ncbi:MAG: LssY C-terminal domain-containing protein [Elusimicrobia bacterium]|nr:LssY C-terminal domain-containing protein [Elusimicrobiota bacterium]
MNLELRTILSSIPPRTTGRRGRPGDIVNLLFIGPEKSLRQALCESGWTEIPRTMSRSAWCGLKELFSRKTLTRFPPMNTYRLLGKKQDMNFVQVIRPVLERHHFRLWKLPHQTSQGEDIWCGSANYDLTLRIWDFSHHPHPNIDKERDYIRETLSLCPWVHRLSYLDFPRPALTGKNDKGYAYFTDGKILWVELK